ncbi:RimJ/RimL family protein N-acetyltransferase [Paenibacillus sp. CAA11]|uniref:GNAT family N-acetyltransferase n=1 Tax=Paenibacillus sp. CAA11 TaxID=1532905 RepID=UPI000D349E1F|nr:GNAT family protein [Paenibacillus sp. CAA11]AWB46357.1 RimJ/RimL family protein N-acetyltransferase [Paenibacillus sp. CAA11]
MQDVQIELRPLREEDAEQLLDLRVRNRAFLQPYEPIRPEGYLTLEEQRKQIGHSHEAARSGLGQVFGIFIRRADLLIGRIELSGIARGPFQNANLGYFMDKDHNGKGYMSLAVRGCVGFAFEQLGLHRIQAAVMPHNLPSRRVLGKAGFREEGLAQRYLKINGSWADHVLYAITAEELNAQPSDSGLVQVVYEL